ncbi:MAG: hypothetical protein GXO49_05170 [Chlorobi bacterium]|nr:hypothetical protein [Chlorobiota bacterium]
MSQVRVRKVERIVEANVVDAVTTCINTNAEVDSAIALSTNSELKALISNSVVVEKAKNIVQTPEQLKVDFSTSFSKNMEAMVNTNVNNLVKQKVAVINAIKEGGYKIQTGSIIKNGIAKIISSETENGFKTAVNTLMNNVKNEHNTVFTQSVANVVKDASVAIGFTNVSLVYSDAKVSVIAENNQGEAILTEVRIDRKTSKVDLVSETIGIADNSCNVKLNQLDKELEKRGIKHKESKVKWTGGDSWLPTSKKIEKKIKTKKKTKQSTSTKKSLYRKVNVNKLKN